MEKLNNVLAQERSSRRRWRGGLLRVAGGLMGLWTLIPTSCGHRLVIINTSESVPPGLYLRSATTPAVGQIIDFKIPNLARHYIRMRTGNDGKEWYILKPIAAGPGDRVDTTGSSLFINGRAIAPMPPGYDRVGRRIPVWRENHVLGPHEFFVFSARIPNSFDSRCYGPVSSSDVESVLRPLITLRPTD